MKKFIALILIIGVFLSVAVAISVSSAAYSNVYFAFGDSIAAGYGLSNRGNAYPYLLANKLGMSVTNLAQDGLTSTGLVNVINSISSANKTQLAKASLITISIGGNDLIGVDNFYSVVLPELQTYFSSDYQMSAAMKAIYTKFESNLSTAFSKLHSLAPNARICIQTLYNPYLVGLGALTVGRQLDYFIDQLNNSMYSASRKLSYVDLIDVASEMNGHSNYFYGGSSLFDLDFHPTLAGHVKISEIIYEACDYLHTTKATTTQTTKQTTTITTSQLITNTSSSSIYQPTASTTVVPIQTTKQTSPSSTSRSIYDPYATKETVETSTTAFITIKTETSTTTVESTVQTEETTTKIIALTTETAPTLETTTEATTATSFETTIIQTTTETSSDTISTINTTNTTTSQTDKETTQTPATDNKKRGCGAAVGGGIMFTVISSFIGGAFILRKRKSA